MKLAAFFTDAYLTGDQQKLVESLESFFEGKEKKLFLLKGYAGTGKTYMLEGVTKYLEAIGREYHLAAPTGKAAKVLSRKTGRNAYTIHKTIYSAKDIKEYKVKGLDGSETYKMYFDLRLNEDSGNAVYIIDEVSMLSDSSQEGEFFRFGSGRLLTDLLEYINLDHNDHDKKIIFVGDNAQLPPVGMSFSPALNHDYLLKEHGIESREIELTEVVRQRSESGILANAITLRNALKERKYNSLAIDKNYPDLHHIEIGVLMQHYFEKSREGQNREAIIIAHSNKMVQAYNQEIRTRFFPGKKTIAEGDRIIVTANNYHYELFLSNGEFGEVLSVSEETESRKVTIRRKNEERDVVEDITITLTFRDVVISFVDIENRKHDIECKILENLLHSDKAALSSDENKALYLDFVIRNKHLKPKTTGFKDALLSDPWFNALKIKYGYAITCHKAQGSEWKDVFVNCRTSLAPLTEGYFRWLYTAITRSSGDLYLLNEPNIAYGATMRSSNTQHHNKPAKTAQHPIHDTASAEELKKYGIESAESLPASIYKLVKSLIRQKDISILSIRHDQYCELYRFGYKEKTASLKLYYNSKNIISKIMRIDIGPFADAMMHVLEPLLHRRVDLIEQNSKEERKAFRFDELFLEDHYRYISSLLNSDGIEVVDIKHNQWQEKYTFRRENDHTVIDFSYNGKKQFTHFQAESKRSSSSNFASEVLGLIEGRK